MLCRHDLGTARYRVCEEISHYFQHWGIASVPLELGNPQATDVLLVIIEQIEDDEKKAIPLLRAALKDANSSVRLAAVNALRRIGPNATAVLPALWPLLQDKDQIVRNAAEDAIKRIDRTQAAE